MRTRFTVLLALTLGAIACGSPDGARDAGVRRDGGAAADASNDAGGTARDAGEDAGSGDDAGGGEDAAIASDGGGPVTTRIRVVYPAGTSSIAIRGSGGPLSWEAGVALSSVGGGVYELVTDEITTTIEWKPLLDDATWAIGPNYHVEPGQAIEVAPHFVASAGRVVALPDFDSAILGSSRPVWAYLPPSYDENTAARFPVVYMHDGQNLFDASLAFGGNEWEVDESIDRAAGGGVCEDGTECQNDGDCGGARCDTFREPIVIGVGNTSARIDDYTPTRDDSVGAGGGADLYLRALIEELAPTIDAAMRTRGGSAETAMIGSSLGGLVSSYAGVVHPDAFGLIGAMSPSTWWDERTILTTVASIPSRPSRALRVYVDSGDSGPSSDGVADTADLAAAYRAAGYADGVDLEYVVEPGGQHNEIYWRGRLPGALRFLLGPRERAVP